jgi:hypothetical protein
MMKRLTTSVLWFFTVATAWNFVVLAADAPSGAGALLGAVAATLVWFDPLGLLASKGESNADRTSPGQAAPVAGLGLRV